MWQRRAAADENPLTGVRSRGHSSHLVCRTSGFLFLCPPPPSPSRLHGESLSPRIFRKRWSPRGVQNPGLNASLQASLYCRATLCLWLPPTPFPTSYCHSTSPHLLYNQLSSTRPLLADNAVFLSCLFHCSALPLLLCLSSSRAQGLCNRGTRIQPCCSHFRRMSWHFFEADNAKRVLPLAHSTQQQQQQHCMQTAVRGQIKREGGRERQT